MQLINVAAGGTLYQDLAEELPGAIKHDYFPFRGQSFARDYLAHEVEIAGGTRLATVLGAGQLRVNSMHHQGVKKLGQGLVSTAVSPDGLVEAIEGRKGSYLMAVQWHPEALTDTDARTRTLFTDFVGAAQAHQ
jgi:putative glutamine amidotransferase